MYDNIINGNICINYIIMYINICIIYVCITYYYHQAIIYNNDRMNERMSHIIYLFINLLLLNWFIKLHTLLGRQLLSIDSMAAYVCVRFYVQTYGGFKNK